MVEEGQNEGLHRLSFISESPGPHVVSNADSDRAAGLLDLTYGRNLKVMARIALRRT